MSEQNRTKNNVGTDELSLDELNSVAGGTSKTAPPKPWPAPPDPKETVTFEYGGLVVQYVQQTPN
jgi:hypothetical protein